MTKTSNLPVTLIELILLNAAQLEGEIGCGELFDIYHSRIAELGAILDSRSNKYLYLALNRLEDKGYLRSRKPGKTSRFVRITPKGTRMLQTAREILSPAPYREQSPPRESLSYDI